MSRIILLCLFFIFQIAALADEKSYIVKNGYIDLQNASIEKGDIIQLHGEWEFFWAKFIKPGEMQKGRKIDTPGTWVNNNGNYKAFGYASYRIRFTADDIIVGKVGALKIGDVCTAYEVFANGNKIGSAGQIGTSRGESIPKYIPQIVFFRFEKENEIIFYVSNYHNKAAGVWDSVLIGMDSAIIKLREKKLAFEIFLLGSIFIMAIYHFGLYFLQRRKKIFLIFGLFCLNIAIRTFLTGERFITSILPELSWEIMFKIEFLTFVIGIMLFLTFIRELFEHKSGKVIAYTFYTVILVFSVIIIFTNAGVYTSFQQAFQITSLFIVGYSVYLVIYAVMQKREGAYIFLTGTIILLITYINDILYVNQLIRQLCLLQWDFSFSYFLRLFFCRRSLPKIM